MWTANLPETLQATLTVQLLVLIVEEFCKALDQSYFGAEMLLVKQYFYITFSQLGGHIPRCQIMHNM